MPTREEQPDMVEELLTCAGLPEKPEHPVIDSPEQLRALDDRLFSAKEEELKLWEEVKRTSQEESTRDFLS